MTFTLLYCSEILGPPYSCQGWGLCCKWSLSWPQVPRSLAGCATSHTSSQRAIAMTTPIISGIPEMPSVVWLVNITDLSGLFSAWNGTVQCSLLSNPLWQVHCVLKKWIMKCCDVVVKAVWLYHSPHVFLSSPSMVQEVLWVWRLAAVIIWERQGGLVRADQAGPHTHFIWGERLRRHTG